MSLRQYAFASALMLSAPAIAAEALPVEKYRPGNVIVAFEGGEPGKGLGTVLLALATGENLLFTKPYTIKSGDTPCLIAGDQLGIPRPCSTDFLRTLDILNPKLRPSRGVLSIGQTILLPDIWVRSYRTAQTFSNSVAKQRTRGFTIQKNWAHLDTKVVQKTEGSEQIEFNAYELILRSNDPARQAKLMERMAPFKTSLNISPRPIGFAATRSKAYGDVFLQECARVPPLPPRIDYRMYADTDGDLAAHLDPPATRRATKVILLDVKLVASPNLAGAIDGDVAPTATSPRPRCSWTGAASKRQHATHLAGIIASRDNGFGFVGLSPTSKIKSYELLQPDDQVETGLSIPPGRTEWLADMLDTDRESQDPYFYLIAANLAEYPPSMINRFNQIDRKARFDDVRQLEKRIDRIRPLFVVAAGQDAQPVALSPTTPMSPQNLGDLQNVLVVTACEACTRHDPHLMRNANYAGDGRAVHVAAPGGAPLVGWVDGSGVGEAQGTSQAAAYTAGVIAEMMGRWSDSYRDADRVKKRIQVTSWPFYKRVGHTDDDHDRLATGIVDPALALLNPRQHWIKDASGWRPIALRGFSSDTLAFLKAGNVQLPVSSPALARYVRVTKSGEPARWVIYTDASKLDSNLLGEVHREGPLEPPANVTLVPCQGPPIPLAAIDDLVIANGGIGNGSCGG